MPRPIRRAPRARRELTPEEREIRRTRVTPYQARIERMLTDVYIEVPENRQADAEWIFTHAIHINGYTTCQLCGHNPIRRLFFIKHRETGRELCLGSECIRNYVRVDLVEAYLRQMTRQQGRIRQNREREERNRIWRERQVQERENRRAAAARWRQENADLLDFIAEQRFNGNTFIREMSEWLESHSTLTERQTEVSRDIMRNHNLQHGIRPLEAGPAEESHANADEPEEPEVVLTRLSPQEETVILGVIADQDEPATAHEAFAIPNGIFGTSLSPLTRARSSQIRIHTVQTGPLQGKRIIKRWNEEEQRWKGFAFLTRAGTAKAWAGATPSDMSLADRVLNAVRENRLVTRECMCNVCNSPTWRTERYCQVHGGATGQEEPARRNMEAQLRDVLGRPRGGRPTRIPRIEGVQVVRMSELNPREIQ